MPALTSYSAVLQPKLLIDVDGNLATDLAKDLSKFEFVEGDNKMLEARFVFHDKEQKYVADNRLHQHGVTFGVRWGYPGDLSEKFNAIITRAKPTFPKQGMPVVEAIAWDPRVAMNRLSSSRNWGRVSSSEVARQIAKLYKFKADIEESDDVSKKDKVQGASVSDIQYLLQLADKINFACYFDGDGVLHYHPHRFGTEAPDLTFWYFSNRVSSILTFAPKVKMEKNKPGKTGTNQKNGKPVAEKPKEGSSGDKSPNMHLVGVNLPTGTHYKHNNPKGSSVCGASTNTDKKAAQTFANAALQKVDMSAIEATCTVIGTPRLRAYKAVSLQGLGPLYSGTWYVKKVRHVIQPTGDVYTCEMELARADPKKGKGGKKPTESTTKNGKGDVSEAREGMRQRFAVVLNTGTHVIGGLLGAGGKLGIR